MEHDTLFSVECYISLARGVPSVVASGKTRGLALSMLVSRDEKSIFDAVHPIENDTTFR